jgi:FkbM family methyltransferase
VAELPEALAIGRREAQLDAPHQAERADGPAPRADRGAGASVRPAPGHGPGLADVPPPPAGRPEPDSAAARNDLGIALANQGRLDEAADAFRQALRLQPDYPDAHNNLGIVLVLQDRLDEAVASYQQALRLKPNYPEAHNNLGTMLARQGRLDEAVASYQEALRLQPADPEAHNNLGLALARQDRLDEAMASYQEALRLRPSYPAGRPDREAPAAAVVPAPPGGDGRLLLDQGHLRVKHCRYGPMAYLLADRFIGRSLDRYGEFSEGEAELFRQVVRPGWTVVEVGANIGAHTVSLAKATGPLGRVLAFEPQRVIFQILCANLVLNGLRHAETFHAAAGREPGTITVPRLDETAPANFGGVSLGGHVAGEAARQMTIDGLNLPACHLLKIDVEGMEGEVLAGADQTIRRWRPVLYVENDRPEKSAALIRQLLGLGYRLYWHVPPLFNPHNFFGATDNVFGGLVSANMLGFHGSVSQNVTDLREITDPEDDWKAGC